MDRRRDESGEEGSERDAQSFGPQGRSEESDPASSEGEAARRLEAEVYKLPLVAKKRTDRRKTMKAQNKNSDRTRKASSRKDDLKKAILTRLKTKLRAGSKPHCRDCR
jgi:hypothetical protein